MLGQTERTGRNIKPNSFLVEAKKTEALHDAIATSLETLDYNCRGRVHMHMLLMGGDEKPLSDATNHTTCHKRSGKPLEEVIIVLFQKLCRFLLVSKKSIFELRINDRGMPSILAETGIIWKGQNFAQMYVGYSLKQSELAIHGYGFDVCPMVVYESGI